MKMNEVPVIEMKKYARNEYREEQLKRLEAIKTKLPRTYTEQVIRRLSHYNTARGMRTLYNMVHKGVGIKNEVLDALEEISGLKKAS